jgi:hypothetical protein
MQKKIKSIAIISILALGVLFVGTKSNAQSYMLGMIEVKFCNQEQSNTELDIVTKA